VDDRRGRIKALLSKAKNYTLWGLVGLAVLGVLVMVGGYFYLARDLPALHSLQNYRPPVITQVYADDGTLLAEFSEYRRKLVKLERTSGHELFGTAGEGEAEGGERGIPKHVQLAFIATEDRRFLEHRGVDWWGVLRAFYINLKYGQIREGASTITMQLAKTFFLEHEISASYKLKQAILALRIEQYLSKPDILYLYLNQVDLGRMNFGVGAAAEYYFGKHVSELSLAEGAMLAGICPAPSSYNPVNNFEYAKSRQEHVLAYMVKEGLITEEQADAAYAEPVKVAWDRGAQGEEAPDFTEHVRRILIERYGRDAVYHGGLKVFTTVNIKADKAAARSVEAHVRGRWGVDKVLGYRGPLSKEPLDEEAAGKFLEEQEQDHREDWVDAKWKEALNEGRAGEVSKEELRESAPDPVPLEDREFYKAVVTKVDDRLKEAWVMIGHNRARIGWSNMSWAGEYDKKNKPPVRLERPSDALQKGDLVLVRIVEHKETRRDGPYYEVSLEQKPEIQAGLMAMSTRTGHVKALCGGVSGHFIRPIQAKRQPGSAFKPIVYGAAIDSRKFTPATILLDSPIIFDSETRNPECPRDVTIWERYTPKNYSDRFTGPQSVRNALALSINTIAVKVCWDLCLPNVIQWARKLGIKSELDRLPCLALGCSEVTLEELLTAYNVYASGGYLVEPVYITRVYDRDGNLLEYEVSPDKEEEHLATVSEEALRETGIMADFEGLEEEDITGREDKKAVKARHIYLDRLVPPQQLGEPVWQDYLALIRSGQTDWLASADAPPRGERVISEQTAYLIDHMLSSTAKWGTGAEAYKRLERPVAGKTGTTNNYRDAWFLGFTPEFIAGVWVGGDSYYYPLGRGMTGSRAALPIWLDFMEPVIADRPKVDFKAPPGVEWVKIDKTTGKRASECTPPGNRITEVFIKGTAPEEYADCNEASPLDYRDPLRKVDSFGAWDFKD